MDLGTNYAGGHRMDTSSSIWTVEVARALLDTICLLLVNSEQSMAEFSSRYRCG